MKVIWGFLFNNEDAETETNNTATEDSENPMSEILKSEHQLRSAGFTDF